MRLERLLAIIVLLLNRRRLTAGELAQRFEVSVRTIYRDIAALNGAGIPVIATQGHEGGLAIPDGYKLSRQLLPARDLAAMLATLRGVNRAMANRDLERIIDTLDNLLSPENDPGPLPAHRRLVVDITPWGPALTPEQTVETVQRAVDGALLLEFAYTDSTGQASRRRVEPHVLVFKGYAWYVIAYCRLRRDFRIFRLSRISAPRLCGEAFVPREVGDIGRFLDFHCGPVEPVRLRVAAAARARVEDLFPGTDFRPDGEGTYTIDVQLPDDPWLFSLLLGFGTDLQILAPQSWRDKMKKNIRAIAEVYAT